MEIAEQLPEAPKVVLHHQAPAATQPSMLVLLPKESGG